MLLNVFFGVIIIIFVCTIGTEPTGFVYKFVKLEINDNGNDPGLNINGLKLVKVNKTHWAITGPVVVTKAELEPQLMTKVSLWHKKSMSYQQTSLVDFNRNYCELLEDPLIKPHLVEYNEAIGMAPTCPHENGEYFLNNYMPDTDKFPPMPVGEYFFRVNYYVDEDQQIQLDVYFEIEYDTFG